MKYKFSNYHIFIFNIFMFFLIENSSFQDHFLE